MRCYLHESLATWIVSLFFFFCLSSSAPGALTGGHQWWHINWLIHLRLLHFRWVYIELVFNTFFFLSWSHGQHWRRIHCLILIIIPVNRPFHRQRSWLDLWQPLITVLLRLSIYLSICLPPDDSFCAQQLSGAHSRPTTTTTVKSAAPSLLCCALLISRKRLLWYICCCCCDVYAMMIYNKKQQQLSSRGGLGGL